MMIPEGKEAIILSRGLIIPEGKEVIVLSRH